MIEDEQIFNTDTSQTPNENRFARTKFMTTFTSARGQVQKTGRHVLFFSEQSGRKDRNPGVVQDAGTVV